MGLSLNDRIKEWLQAQPFLQTQQNQRSGSSASQLVAGWEAEGRYRTRRDLRGTARSLKPQSCPEPGRVEEHTMFLIPLSTRQEMEAPTKFSPPGKYESLNEAANSTVLFFSVCNTEMRKLEEKDSVSKGYGCSPGTALDSVNIFKNFTLNHKGRMGKGRCRYLPLSKITNKKKSLALETKINLN